MISLSVEAEKAKLKKQRPDGGCQGLWGETQVRGTGEGDQRVQTSRHTENVLWDVACSTVTLVNSDCTVYLQVAFKSSSHKIKIVPM